MDSLKRKADLKFGEGEIDEAMSFYTSALEVVDVNIENNHLIIKGSIPGPKGSIVTIQK